jgi:hypothetical protein
MLDVGPFRSLQILETLRADFPKTVGPSVLTDRNAVGPTISKYISDRMSGKT